MTHSTSPPLNAHHRISLGQDAKLDALLNPPAQTSIHILLPIGSVKVWFLFGKEEWVNTTVEVRVLCLGVNYLFKDSWRILTREAVGFRVTMRMGQIGRYFDIKRAELPLL